MISEKCIRNGIGKDSLVAKAFAEDLDRSLLVIYNRGET